jgi:hypothetical protein
MGDRIIISYKGVEFPKDIVLWDEELTEENAKFAEVTFRLHDLMVKPSIRLNRVVEMERQTFNGTLERVIPARDKARFNVFYRREDGTEFIVSLKDESDIPEKVFAMNWGGFNNIVSDQHEEVIEINQDMEIKEGEVSCTKLYKPTKDGQYIYVQGPKGGAGRMLFAKAGKTPVLEAEKDAYIGVYNGTPYWRNAPEKARLVKPVLGESIEGEYYSESEYYVYFRTENDTFFKMNKKHKVRTIRAFGNEYEDTLYWAKKPAYRKVSFKLGGVN